MKIMLMEFNMSLILQLRKKKTIFMKLKINQKKINSNKQKSQKNIKKGITKSIKM